uniref:TLC domain-containing protein n=1 Tax=Lygus hesperus TaxID=30085 RepID=A0A0A9Y8C0_LYGHE
MVRDFQGIVDYKVRIFDLCRQMRELIGTHPLIHSSLVTCLAMMCGSIMSVSAWRVAYYIMMKNRVKEDIAHRSLAIAEGLFAVCATILVGNLNERAFDGDYVNTWSQNVLLVCSSGYFAHDSFYFVYNSIDDAVNLAHHFITYVSMMYSTVIGKYGSLIMFYHWAYESTSVPLHLRYIMRKWKMNRTHPELFTVTELSFIILYAFERFVIGVHFSYHILCTSGDIIPVIPKILCATINLSSVAFYNSVFALFVRRYGDEFEFFKNLFTSV